MDKITYLAELAEGLARWVPERERQNTLRYYAEYFEEAGPEREAEVVAELGDPWALSCRLAVEGGYVTWEKAASWKPRKTWRRVLIGTAVGLTVFALVAGIGLLGALGYNVMRTGSGRPAFAEAEQVTVVDWGISPVWGEYNVAFAEDEMGFTGFYYTDGGNLAVFDSIDVDISLGDIEVVYADGFTLSVNRSEALLGYEPAWEVTDGVLRIRDGDLSVNGRPSGWDDLKNMFSVGQWAMNVTITVPEGVALDNINVETGLGDVTLWGVDAETVTAETGLGGVSCYEARNVKRLELTTGVGDVCLGLEEVCPGLSASLETGTGDVEVNLDCSESDCRYELESGLGFVTVNGGLMGSSAKHRGDLPYVLSAESGTGNVNVWFNG